MNAKNDPRPGRRPLLGLLAVLAVLAAIAVAGCGGSSGDSTSADSTASSGGGAEPGGAASGGGPPGGFEIDDEALACLEEQGVELPEMGEGGGLPEGGAPPTGEPPEGGPPEGFGGGEDMQKAFEECGIDAPQGGGAGGPPTDSAEFRESIEDYVACVRENGYDLPDPNLSGEGPVFSESEVDQSDPEFKAASEECQSLIGTPGGGEG
ncbi:MAG TPA: hypothetical protein VHR18_05975 [Solirubrobacterales bacterium]|jgi:hypothetical protein|nr:hypothetical protein [Solirubrobacterales bacterium]